MIMDIRIGNGYDVHALDQGLPLWLGGVQIDSPIGCIAHSDGDVAIHALCDALLGALALGDIGRHFPDNDEAFAGANSLKLAEYVADLLVQHGYAIVNVDATLIAQRPKISPYIETMRENLADALGIEKGRINVKATTEEHLGFTGEGLGMAAHAVCLIEKI